MRISQLLGDRGHRLEHLLPYIGISGAAAFFARLDFRFAALRFVFVFFAFLAFLAFFFVFRAAPFAATLRTARFFARFFVFFFFAVIGMCNDSSNVRVVRLAPPKH
jgi:hypothetical protein